MIITFYIKNNNKFKNRNKIIKNTLIIKNNKNEYYKFKQYRT
jgi:hypothetical protein